jgi:hypothetical protein
VCVCVCVTVDCELCKSAIALYLTVVKRLLKTTSFTPPSVIKLHLLFAHAFTFSVF